MGFVGEDMDGWYMYMYYVWDVDGWGFVIYLGIDLLCRVLIWLMNRDREREWEWGK